MPRSRPILLLQMVLVFALGLSLASPQPALAATINVTSLADGGAGSLRQAILDAQTGAFPGADIINITLSGTITLNSVLPSINSEININNTSSGSVTVARNGSAGDFSVFVTSPGSTLRIDGLTISNGRNLIAGGGVQNNSGTVEISNSTISGNSADDGGGVFNNGPMTLTNVTVSGNTADSDGGGIYNGSNGTLVARHSTIANNTSTAPVTGQAVTNVGISFTMGHTILASPTNALKGTVISEGYNLIQSLGLPASVTGTTTGNLLNVDPDLGVLANNGGPTQTHFPNFASPVINAGNPAFAAPPSTDQRKTGFPRIQQGRIDIGAVEANFVPAANPLVNDTGDGSDNNPSDGICDSEAAMGAQCSLRAAIENAQASVAADTITFAPGLADQTITLNKALLEISTQITIDNTTGGSVTVTRSASATTDFTVFDVRIDGNLTLNRLTISGGTGKLVGGNRVGGGLYNNGGTLAVTNSIVSGNTARNGGGVYHNSGTTTLTSTTLSGNTISGGTPTIGNGGGIYVNGGTLNVVNSTVSGNTAVTGGGLYNNGGTLNLTNSTVSGNHASGSGGTGGGGLLNNNGTTTILHSTIANNTSPSANQGIHRVGGTVTLGHTILASAIFPALEGSITSQGYNLIQSRSDFSPISGDLTGNLLDINPNLSVLGSYGGLTQTHLPNFRSPVINAGNPTISGEPATDQRGTGFSRIQQGRIDIGAVELNVSGLNNPVVNVNSDNGDTNLGDGLCDSDTAVGNQCSLRAAMENAEGDADLDTITFEAGLTGQTISFTSASPIITTPVTINNTTGGALTVRRSSAGGTPDFSVFVVNSGGNLSLDRLTISGGTGSNGGGVHNNSGTVAITNSTISGNSVSGNGGGVYTIGSGLTTLTNTTVSGNQSPGFPGLGAGLYNAGTTRVTSSTVSGNMAMGSGGGFYSNSGTLEVTNSTVSGNQVNQVSSQGGGLYVNGGAATVRHTTIFNNSSGGPNGQNVRVESGTLTLGHTIISTPSSTFLALVGDVISEGFNLIQSNGGTISGNTTGNISGNPQLGTLDNGGPTQTHLPNIGSPVINAGNSTISGEPDFDQRGEDRIVATIDMGAVETDYQPAHNPVVNVTTDGSDTEILDGVCDSDSVTAGPQCSLRAAIQNANADADADTIGFDGALAGQTITLFTVLPEIVTEIDIDNSSGGSITVTRDSGAATNFSIFIANTGGDLSINRLNISGGTGTTDAAAGGGLAGGGILVRAGALTLTNSSVYDNQADAGAGILITAAAGPSSITSSTISGNAAATSGGAILNRTTLAIRHSTIVDNSAPSLGGIDHGSGVLTLGHTIVDNSGDGAPLVFTSEGYNWITQPVSGGSSGNPTDIFTGDPELGPLADNGGPTLTHLPDSESPVIDTGDPAFSGPPITDQRGLTREINVIDRGAVETAFLIVNVDSDDADTNPGDGVCDSDATAGQQCSLRAAIETAQSASFPDADEITFDPTLAGDTITLDTALPEIVTGIAMTNDIGGSLTVARDSGAATDFSVFLVTDPAAHLSIDRLTISGGTGSPLGGNPVDLVGGGIQVFRGALTLMNSTVTGNEALVGGGIFANTGSGPHHIINSTISGNHTTDSAGGIFLRATTFIRHSTIANNSADSGPGGIESGTSNPNWLHMGHTIVADNGSEDVILRFVSEGYNLVENMPGPVDGDTTGNIIGVDPQLGPLASNGGVTQTHLPFPGSRVIDAGNPAISSAPPFDQRGVGFLRVVGGVIDIGAVETDFPPPAENMMVNDPSDAGDHDFTDGRCDVNPGMPNDQCTLRAAIQNTNADPDDDIIIFAFNLPPIQLQSALPDITRPTEIFNINPTIVEISRSGSAATDFSIFVVRSTGSLNLDRLTLSGGTGTAFFSARVGGAIFNDGATVTITNSTILNGSAAEGGGIYSFNGTVTITNSTLSGNTATAALVGEGGGGLKVNFGTATVLHSTIASNTAAGTGGGIYNGGTLNLGHTIVADNGANDIDGSVESLGYNLIGTHTGSINETPATSILGVDPSLNPLAFNGGPTQTHMPALGSPVVNAGNAAITGEPDFDQRGDGFARVFGGVIDIGSVETTYLPPVDDPVVNVLGDGPDLDLSDGVCDADPAVEIGCTLRAAIENAEADADADTITFTPELAGQTITLDTALPQITTEVVIDNTHAATITVSRSATAATDFSVFVARPGGNLSIDHLTISGGTGTDFFGNRVGGGIFNWGGSVTVSGSTVTGNHASGQGGGLANFEGPTTVTASTISGNSATFGGGIVNFAGSVASPFTVMDSTITDNTASSEGGGIRTNGVGVTLINSTVSGNRANSAGGGASANGGPGLTARHSTIVDNVLTGGDANSTGGIAGDAILSHTIVANNSGRDLATAVTFSEGFNLIENPGPGSIGGTMTGNIIGVDPALGSLAGNGGPTQTHLPRRGSPVINAGNSAFNPPPATDQHGQPREVDVIDIGSVETAYQPPVDNAIVNVDTDSADFDLNDTVCDSDSGSTGNQCSLRAAIQNAEEDTDADKITFEAALADDTITLLTALPDITTNVTIDDTHVSTITVARSASAADDFAIFFVASNGVFNIDHLTLTGGTGTPGTNTGGAIDNDGGVVEVANSVLTGNTASFAGGAISNSGSGSVTVDATTFSDNDAFLGGALSSTGGLVTITNSTFSGNEAESSGGAIYNDGTLNLTNSTVSANQAIDNDGGGISNTGTATIRHSTIVNNTSDDGGDGIHSTDTLTLGHTILADNGTLDLDGAAFSEGYNLLENIGTSLISGDTATNFVLANPDLRPLAVNGGPTQTHLPNRTSVAVNRGNPDFVPPPDFDQRGTGFPREVSIIDIGAVETVHVLVLPNNPVVNVNTDDADFDLLDGVCDSDPAVGEQCSLRAAIENSNADADPDTITFNGLSSNVIFLFNPLEEIDALLTINNTTGGLLTIARHVTAATDFSVFVVVGNLTIDRLTISGGTGTSVSFSSGRVGGGIYNAFGTLTVTNSTISGNGAQSEGGGIENLGSLTVTNSTISGNSAGGEGGGIRTRDPVTLTNSTISGNTANGGGGIFVSNVTITVLHSTITDNTASFGAGVFVDPGVSGTGAGGVNLGHAIISGNTGSDLDGRLVNSLGFNFVGGDPQLGPLNNHGGLTLVHLPDLGSPVIDAGDPDFAPPPDTDQRGLPREIDIIDIGSVETDYQPPVNNAVVNVNTDGSDTSLIDGVCDSDAATGEQCSLRAAIENAEADSDADTITFIPALAGDTITLLTALPNITTEVVIDNTHASTITVTRSASAGTDFSIFVVRPTGDLTIDSLTMTGGNGTPDPNFGGFLVGGGVFNDGGAAALTGSFVTGNNAFNGGGIRNGPDGMMTITNSSISDNEADVSGGISNGGTLELTNSTVSGNTSGQGGGGINNGGTLTLTNSTVSGNSAVSPGGGGIFNSAGTLTIFSSTVSGNSVTGTTPGSDDGGGGIYVVGGTVTARHSTIAANTSTIGGKGIHHVGGTVNLGHTIVASATSPAVQGDFNSEGYNLIQSYIGGTINGDTTGNQIGADTLLGDLADNDGPTLTHLPNPLSPAIDAGNPAIVGAPATDQRGEARIVDVIDIGSVETDYEPPVDNPIVNVNTDGADTNLGDGICDSDVAAGEQCSLRAALENAEANSSVDTITFVPALAGDTITLLTALPNITTEVVIDNAHASTITVTRSASAGTNFSIFNVTSTGDLNIDSLTITGGTGTDGDGGGIYLRQGSMSLTNSAVSGNQADMGGAIFNHSGTLALTNSTVSGNQADMGGGIFNNGAMTTLTSSTLSGNHAIAGMGGGMVNTGGTVTIRHSTIASNTASSGGQSIHRLGGTFDLGHTIVASASSPAAEGNLTSAGYNLIQSHTGGTISGDTGNDLPLGTDPDLGALGNNGGLTQTHLPNPTSPVINAGNPAFTPPPATDQRGETRIVEVIDIGSVETEGATPTVINVTSTNADGTYGVGSVITITVTFSDAVNVTGTPTLALSNGGTASYISGSGTDTLTFTYTVAAGEDTPDLDYTVTDSLALSGGTINSIANVPADLTLPVPGAAGSLGANRNIVIETAAPTVAISSPSSDPTSQNPIPVIVTFSEPVTGFDASDVVVTNSNIASFFPFNSEIYTFDLVPLVEQGVVTVDIPADVAQDTAGNPNEAAAQFARTFDVNVLSVTITSPAPDPTNQPIPVTITFTSPVTDFDISDLLLGNATAQNFSGSGDTYTMTLVALADGLVTLDIPAGAAQDADSNPNTAAAQFTRVFDGTALSVTVAPAEDQDDPTSEEPITFTVIFSEDVTGFDETDVTLGGTAGATTAVVTPVSGSEYTVSVTGMTSVGTVTVSIPAGAAQDTAGNLNEASNEAAVNFVVATTEFPLVVSINRFDPNPTDADKVRFVVTFSEAVTGVDEDDFELAVDGLQDTSIELVDGEDDTYVVRVNTGDGEAGTLGLNLVDDDSIRDADGNRLGGAGEGNGDFVGQVYTIEREPEDDDEDAPAPSLPAIPVQNFLCDNLATQTNSAMTGSGGMSNMLVNGLSGDSYCHVIALDGMYVTNPGEVGNQMLIDMGVVQAVDVFGLLPGGVSVMQFSSPVHICLRGSGSVYFISAIDNSVQLLAATPNGGYLCVDVWTAGKLVLVGTANPGALPPADSSQSQAAPPAQSSAPQMLDGCEVTTTNMVRLRSTADTSSDDNVITTLPFEITLTATEYLPGDTGWYRVIYRNGQGYVREDFLNTEGTCAA